MYNKGSMRMKDAEASNSLKYAVLFDTVAAAKGRIIRTVAGKAGCQKLRFWLYCNPGDTCPKLRRPPSKERNANRSTKRLRRKINQTK